MHRRCRNLPGCDFADAIVASVLAGALIAAIAVVVVAVVIFVVVAVGPTSVNRPFVARRVNFPRKTRP